MTGIYFPNNSKWTQQMIKEKKPEKAVRFIFTLWVTLCSIVGANASECKDSRHSENESK